MTPPSRQAHRRRFQSRPTRVGSACKRIVRYVHDQGLRAGDRLPPQDQLRRLMGFSNDTLLAAMGMLVARGGLRRQSGRGTEICDLEALYGINWTVGIAGLVAPDSGPGAFYGALLHRILSRLSRANCRCNTYFRGEHVQMPCHLSDFPGLEGDVADEALDGLVLLTIFDERQCRSVERRGIPLCHVGFWDSMPHATVVDRGGLVADAAALLAARGVRRPALVNGDAEGLLAKARALAAGGPGRELLAACECVALGWSHDTWAAAARRLCAGRRDQRPEALIFTDDYSAQAATDVLARQADYRPLIVVATTRQLPLAYALPVIRFELDLEELADRAITNFRKRLLNPAANGGIEYVKPRVCESDGESRLMAGM